MRGAVRGRVQAVDIMVLNDYMHIDTYPKISKRVILPLSEGKE
jgi:hypothetical protein